MDTPDSTRGDRPIPVPPMPIGMFADRYRPPCVGHGKPSVIVHNGRCVECRDERLRFCPWCSRDISPEVEYEVASRWRAASHAVNDLWVAQDMYGDYRAWENVRKAREDASRGEER